MVELLFLAAQIAALIAALYLVVISSRSVVGYGSKMAQMLRISEAVVAVLFIAVATSLPELAIAINAIQEGGEAVNVSIGNLFGANISDLTLVLGAAALMSPMIVRRKLLTDLSGILFLTAVFPLLMLVANIDTRLIGLLLLAAYVVFTSQLLRHKREIKQTTTIQDRSKNSRPMARIVAGLALSIAVLLIAARFSLESALNIAGQLNVANSFIGATIVALGTTLPELSVTTQAALRKRYDTALGNAIGSTVTNLGLILGVLLLVTPFSININVFSVLAVSLIAAVLFVWYFISSGSISRKEGAVLLVFYAFFLIASTVAAFTM
jgi:cation:H+ antiporter